MGYAEKRHDCLDIIANIDNDEILTQMVIDHNVLDLLLELLKHDIAKNKELVLWILSNICTISSHFIDKMIGNGIVDELIKIILANNEEIGVIKEALFCLCNIT